MPNSYEKRRARLREIGCDVLGTSIFCTAIAIIIWLLGLAEPLWSSFFVSFSIGYSITATSLLIQPRLLRAVPPIIASLITTLIGVGAGLLLSGYVLTGDPFMLLHDSYSTPVLGLFFGVLGILFFRAQDQLHEAQTELAHARTEQLAREKAHLETQLKLLQAQIEPHFLFNTLSNVVGMIRARPDAAEKMLIDLTTLLRASLKRTRTEQTTLGDELTVVVALLEINQIRMGDRLRWKLDVPGSIEDIELPPMLLQPLVENAVKHGIEPLEEGGEIRIGASRTDTGLTITIADTGAGLPVHTRGNGDSGVGIANVQSRLRVLFGERASLTLTENTPRGLTATLKIPVPGP